MGTELLEKRVVISGVGQSQIGRQLDRSGLQLTLDAIGAAVADAGLTMDDIDGLSTYPGAGMVGPFGEGGVTALEAALGIRPTWYNTRRRSTAIRSRWTTT